MEGDRSWAFTAPAFAHVQGSAPRPAAAVYCPTGWRKRRRRGGGQGSDKRHKGAAAPPAAPLPAAQPGAAPRRAAAPPPNPAQLVPLRCAWPHPAVLDLLAQQCWPAAGAAALMRPAAKQHPQLGPQPNWWNYMLPSLSLLHPPLAAERQELLETSSGGVGSGVEVMWLPQPNVLVGYEDDWLEVAPQVLPLWQATPLAPFAGPKPLLHCLVCPEPQLVQAQQFVKDVGSLYETCNLGSHLPSSRDAVHAFPLAEQPSSGVAGQAQPPLAARYLAGLRYACEALQRQLLLDPPVELAEQQGSSLEEGCEPAVLVYVACPLDSQADHLAALLEAAACLGPCTPLGAANGGGDSLVLLPSASGLDIATSSQQPVAPAAPAAADRPASATPAADNSRAPGGALPPHVQQEEEAEQLQQQQRQEDQGQQQQERYHGAAQVLHQQQQGDFRQLPLRRIQRPGGARPINIVLQVLTPQALSDLSGTAVRCTAFAVYSKMQRPMLPASSLEQQPGAAVAEEDAVPPCLPCYSQPLLVLASAAAPPPMQDVLQQQQQQQVGSSQGGLLPRRLHCCYGWPPPGSNLLPLVFTDSCGELLHAELLDCSAAGGLDSLGSAASLTAIGGTGCSSSRGTAARPTYSLVLQRCAELLRRLQAATNPPGLLQSLAIAGTDMQQAERQAWRQLLAQEAGELPAGIEVAVVELQALPPARLAGPEPLTGCKLLLQCGSGDEEANPLQACVAWLPPASGTSSLLPQEHDCVRQLQVTMVATRLPEGQAPLPQHSEDCLRRVAGELHGLAWLHAAFQGACLRTVVGGGQAAPADAHLPLHAALAAQLQCLVAGIA